MYWLNFSALEVYFIMIASYHSIYDMSYMLIYAHIYDMSYMLHARESCSMDSILMESTIKCTLAQNKKNMKRAMINSGCLVICFVQGKPEKKHETIQHTYIFCLNCWYKCTAAIWCHSFPHIIGHLCIPV